MKAKLLLLLVLVSALFLVFVPTVALAVEPTKWEYYDATPVGAAFIYDYVWMAQTFTVGTVGLNHAFNVTAIRLWLYRTGSPGNLNVSIRATISGGAPTGSNDLASGVINANTLTISSSGAWYWINMTQWNGEVLSPNTKYAIVARAPSGSIGNMVWWKLVTSGTYVGGNAFHSLDFGVSWGASSNDLDFEVWGDSVTGYTFHGLYDEDTGLLKSASSRAVNVTAYFNDETPSVTFEVNGTYTYSPATQPLFFRYNLETSASTVSQYGLNQPVFNGSSYINIYFPQYEEDTAYTVTATLTWNSTYTITDKTTSGCRINFGTPPTYDELLNWYVHRTITETSQIREYWPSTVENVIPDLYIFDATLTTYDIAFLDLGGVLTTAPYAVVQRLINGTYFTVEKRLVDMEKKVEVNLVQGERYQVVISDSTVSYTFGELMTTSTHTITLTLRGIDFPKATLLTYKYVRIYALRVFDDPLGTITITYQDTLNLTFSVDIEINYLNGSTAYSTQQTTSSFVVSYLSADNETDYQVIATINHDRYGVYSWKQYFPRSFTANPWVLGWLGSLSFNVNFLIGIAIVVCVGAGFSMINPEVGAFLATCAAAVLTLMGWFTIAPGLLITAFCLSLIFGLIVARRRVQTY